MSKIIPSLETVEEKRAALFALTKYYAVGAALAERLSLLLENIDDPAVDRAAWEAMIAEAVDKRRTVAERIEELRLQLGIADPPDQVH
jgi:hypothetical protein